AAEPLRDLLHGVDVRLARTDGALRRQEAQLVMPRALRDDGSPLLSRSLLPACVPEDVVAVGLLPPPRLGRLVVGPPNVEVIRDADVQKLIGGVVDPVHSRFG